MSKVKDRMLALLEGVRGEYISGQTIADRLGVSRMAVSKAADRLRLEGYDITGKQNAGYRLGGDCDIINEHNIRRALHSNRARSIIIADECDSTNTRLRELALSGAADRTVMIADRQTAGRGRYGKTFHSPPGCGLYMSVLILPGEGGLDFDCVSRLTVVAGVAACEAVRSLCDIDARIKWVNDVYCSGKKICGILTEAQLNAETRQVTSAVIGVGLNVRHVDFPPELEDIAASCDDFSHGKRALRATVAAEILDRIDGMLGELSSPGGARMIMSKYRALSCILGEDVTYTRGGEVKVGLAYNIDDDGALVVRFPDGGEEKLVSGEISVRPARRS